MSDREKNTIIDFTIGLQLMNNFTCIYYLRIRLYIGVWL